jgi:hypothetical protein
LELKKESFMLKLLVPGQEIYDEETGEFSTIGDFSLELEHSLLSVSKWESKYQKPFLGPTEKTNEEVFAYIHMMLLNENTSENEILKISRGNIDEIKSYIDSSQSATTFTELPGRPGRREIITSELIYYWMISFNIPFDCETWHLNRLFALIRICNLKNSPQKKMSRREIAAQNQALNQQRKAQLGTSG